MNPQPLAKPMPRLTGASRTTALRELLRSRRRLLVLTHNNPDPDSLGGAVGLQEFARLAAGIPSKLAITGKILRAENQAMVRELGIEMERLETLDLTAFDCVALVDTQPGFGHTFVPPHLTIDIVIDHHVCADAKVGPGDVAFFDVRLAIQRQLMPEVVRQNTNVVEAEQVIGVLVRVEHGIDMADVSGQQL